MALITIHDLDKTLEDTRTILLSATNGDGMVSRADLRRLLQQTEDPDKKRFLEFFYGFLRKLGDRPRMRVTEEVIDRGIAFIREEIIPTFEVRESFTDRTHRRMAQIHEWAFPMAMELIRNTARDIRLSTREVSDRIAELTEGLFFDDYGSEAAIAIAPFFLEHPALSLSPDSFTAALGVDPNTPRGKVARFEPADRVLLAFMEQHLHSGLFDRAKELADLMQANLSDLKVIILGEDNHPDLESNHPVYVVGMGHDSNLAGFESLVIWT